MSCLCCWITFWATQYNSPRVFCLADYSTVFCDLCLSRLSRKPVTTQTAYEPLGATPWTSILPFPIPVNQVGFAWKSAPPVTFHCPVFLAARRTMFFPIHLLHSYVHQSFKWTLPCDSEQACLREPLLALVCRHSSFGRVTPLILCRRRTAYRMINHP